MTTLYVVQALGIGDDEDAWENVRVYATQPFANRFVEMQRVECPDIVYRVEPVGFFA